MRSLGEFVARLAAICIKPAVKATGALSDNLRYLPQVHYFNNSFYVMQGTLDGGSRISAGLFR